MTWNGEEIWMGKKNANQDETAELIELTTLKARDEFLVTAQGSMSRSQHQTEQFPWAWELQAGGERIGYVCCCHMSLCFNTENRRSGSPKDASWLWVQLLLLVVSEVMGRRFLGTLGSVEEQWAAEVMCWVMIPIQDDTPCNFSPAVSF